jgi:uncharacterized protein (UPF0332 family)
MEEKEIKKKRKDIFRQIRMAEERLESASLLIEGKECVDTIPILFKAMDIIIRTLLSFKQKPLQNLDANINSLEEEYREEGLGNEESIKTILSLHELNENYRNEMELKIDERAVKNIFEKTENFLNKAHKFLKAQLTTPEEKRMRKKVRQILLITGSLVGSAVIIFFLVKLSINKFGPQHGLLARYYNNMNLAGLPEVEKIDKKIDFGWGNVNPQKNISGDFSVTWEGRIRIDKSEDYTFYILSDEGTRLFLDDKIIIDTWSDKKRMMEHSGNAKLEKGFHKIKLDYYFDQRHATIQLLWSSPSFKRKTVGNRVLYPPSEPSQSKKKI